MSCLRCFGGGVSCRVSEAELRIIEAVPRPPASMLLLGRSGTARPQYWCSGCLVPGALHLLDACHVLKTVVFDQTTHQGWTTCPELMPWLCWLIAQ